MGLTNAGMEALERAALSGRVRESLRELEVSALEALAARADIDPGYRSAIRAEVRARAIMAPLTDRTPRPRRLADAADPRKEEAIRIDCRRWLEEVLGATVLDTEQGYRADNCRACGASLGKGARTRVTEGTPDLIALVPGFGVWLIETKSAVGTLSPEQLTVQAAARAAGIPYTVARGTADLERAWRELNG